MSETQENHAEYGGGTLFRFFNMEAPKTLPATSTPSVAVLPFPLSNVNSVYMTAYNAATPEEQGAVGVQVSQTFNAFASYRDALAVDPKLFDLGVAIAKADRDSVGQLATRAKAMPALSAVNEAKLWDNLFFQTVKPKSKKITEALTTMLRARHFANVAHDMGDTEDIQALLAAANAIIVVPNALAPNILNRGTKASRPAVDSDTRKVLAKYADADIASHYQAEIVTTLKELLGVQSLYKQEEIQRYSTARATYDETVQPLIQENYKNLVTKPPRNPDGTFPPTLEPDPNATPYVPHIIPPFNYTPADPFGVDYSSMLSAGAARIISRARQTIDKERRKANYDDVISSLEGLQKSYSETIFSNIQQPKKYFNYKGIVLSSDPVIKPNKFVFSSAPILGNEDKHRLFFTQYFADPDSRIREINLDATPGEGGATVSDKGLEISSSDNHVTYLLFEQGLEADTEYVLSGQYSREDSEVPVSFSAKTYKTGTKQYETPSTLYRSSAREGARAIAATSDGVNPSEWGDMYGVTSLGIGMFYRVEQTICCYVPGEVSHIENVMAREYKERSTRVLNRMETSTEETTERESEKLKDTTTTDRHELHSEVARTLQEDKATQIGANAGVSAEFNKVQIHADANFSTSTSSSQNSSFSQAESYAKDIVERAMERVVEKMTYKRTTKMLQEFEETNKHGYDNRAGSEHVTGIYRWVDKIMKNELKAYGKKLMYNFVVPEPSKNYKEWLRAMAAQAVIPILEKPVMPTNPADFKAPSTKRPQSGVVAYDDVTQNNYERIAALYGADIDPLPPSVITIGKTFAETPLADGMSGINTEDKDYITASFKYEFEIPKDYYAEAYDFSFSLVDAAGEDERGDWWFPSANLHLGNDEISGFEIHKNVNIKNHGNYWGINLVQPTAGQIPPNTNNFKYTQTNRYSGFFPVGVSTRNIGSFTLALSLHCKLHPDAIRAWQQTAFTKIMAAYEKKLKEYNDALVAYNQAVAAAQAAQNNANTPQDYGINPTEARIIEQREIKRLCIELMLAPLGYYSNPPYLGGDHYKQESAHAKNYVIQKNQFLEDSAACARFMEIAFDWDIFAYNLYPYYWGPEACWKVLANTTCAADWIFQSFLQSGMASVTVPVRPEFEDHVLYFMATGTIPPAAKLLTEGTDGNWADILQNLPVEEGTVLSTWKTRIPTSLNIIQTGSGPLMSNGLPCSPDCGDVDTPLAGGSGTLSGNNSGTNDIITQITTSITGIINLIASIIKEQKEEDNQNSNPNPNPNPTPTPPPAIDCSAITTQLMSLQKDMNDAQTAYASDPSKCKQLLTALNTLLTQLNMLTATAKNKGCDTKDIYMLTKQVTDQIASVSLTCPE